MVDVATVRECTARLEVDETSHDSQNLATFLRSVERRAFRMAQVAVGNHDDALDIVQEAMTKLVQLYSDKAWDDWRPLFYRILHSRINDFHRRRVVQNRFRTWVDKLRPGGTTEETAADPYEYVAAAADSQPVQQLESQERLLQLERAVRQLPPRQREAFMLRCWEGLSTEQAAAAMKCSKGSVKTHYFRALHALRTQLEGF